MTSSITAVLVALAPFAAVLASLWIAGRVQRGRERARDRQIGLTDAIHLELGAVVAPTVARRPGGGWRVAIAAPLDRPAMVAGVLGVTRRFFARQDDAGATLEILLRDTSGPRRHAIPRWTRGQARETELSVAA
jgi:hypothetical protein